MIHKTRRKELFILISCLLLGFSLRFYTFDHKSLWIDEIYTFNNSRDGIEGQLKFYKENPTYHHPPLFFVLTHLFYPFPKPERDLRVIPLIFGTLSIPMIYFLSRLFSHNIALPCTLSLTLMAYHISLSQDGRSYSLIMFLGMIGLYFFIKHLQTLKKVYLFLTAVLFAILFYTSYSSFLFIVLSQILWFYRANVGNTKPFFSSFLILNGLIFFLCIPWILFIALNYKGHPIMDPFHTETLGSFWSIMYGVLHDWVPHAPLIIVSGILLILFPFVSKFKKNAFVLLVILVLPIGGLYLLVKLLNITPFVVNSRYFINFLPLFFISIYLSLNTIEGRFEMLKRFIRLKLLFVILFIASNLTILPLYYRSEKQDFRGLVSYLEGQLQGGDKIFVGSIAYIPGILHYFKVYPESRHYNYPVWWDDSRKEVVAKVSLVGPNKKITIHYSYSCCTQYMSNGNRVWIVVGKPAMKELKENSPCVLRGVFDGSFSNFRRFPSDASMYLFLWDPKSSDEKGIDLPIE